MRERDIETYLRERVKAAGGWAPKWESPGNNGVPDRIVFFPGNVIVFVETKAPGKKPTPIQQAQHRKLKKLGCRVTVIDGKSGVDGLIEAYTDGILDWYLEELN